MKQIVYKQEQSAILNGVTVSGIQNARQITIIAQLLESGKVLVDGKVLENGKGENRYFKGRGNPVKLDSLYLSALLRQLACPVG